MAGALLLEILKSAGLVALPFTVYFAWKKIGHNVAASYSWRLGKLNASGIGSVTLINLKDRPVPIFELHAVMDGLSFRLKEFDPPFILKPMEATNIEADVVSRRYLGSEVYDWKPPASKPSDVDIYISTSSKTIKCRRRGPASSLGFVMKHRLKMVVSETNSFNGLIYNERAKFALTYTEDGKDKTALIDDAGIIYWNNRPNGLRREDIRDSTTVTAALKALPLAPYISPFVVDDLHERRQPAPRTPSLSRVHPRHHQTGVGRGSLAS